MINKILEEIDKLKPMVMTDMAQPEKAEVEKYKEWVDKIQCRHNACTHSLLEGYVFCSSKKYAIYKTIVYLVNDLYREKHNGYQYSRNKTEITDIIREAVAMTMYFQEKT